MSIVPVEIYCLIENKLGYNGKIYEVVYRYVFQFLWNVLNVFNVSNVSNVFQCFQCVFRVLNARAFTPTW